MQVLYVHGAGGSEQSFQWLKEQIQLPSRFFSYELDDPLSWSIRKLEKRIEIGGPLIVVGHSLGGVMAAKCANLPNVHKLITLNAPFGGLQFAALLSLFSSEKLIQELNYYSPLLTGIRNTKINPPHLAIAGTKGLPFIREINDGVLTVSSQTAIPNVDYKFVALNHFEVLLSPEVAKLINEFINEISFSSTKNDSGHTS